MKGAFNLQFYEEKKDIDHYFISKLWWKLIAVESSANCCVVWLLRSQVHPAIIVRVHTHFITLDCCMVNNICLALHCCT